MEEGSINITLSRREKSHIDALKLMYLSDVVCLRRCRHRLAKCQSNANIFTLLLTIYKVARVYLSLHENGLFNTVFSQTLFLTLLIL